jgi:hypothetical protein
MLVIDENARSLDGRRRWAGQTAQLCMQQINELLVSSFGESTSGRE